MPTSNVADVEVQAADVSFFILTRFTTLLLYSLFQFINPKYLLSLPITQLVYSYKMEMWKCIGEFLSFKWLVGKHNQHKENSVQTGSAYRQTSVNDDTANISLKKPVSKTTQKRSSRVTTYNRPSSQPRNYHIWNNYGHSRQSLNDFHEEQDDYDMMDDLFD